ncbi:hypothetical protein LguiB_002353 [Lonicera macranthoides]
MGRAIDGVWIEYESVKKQGNNLFDLQTRQLTKARRTYRIHPEIYLPRMGALVTAGDEINLLQNSKMRDHPTMAKLIGYYNEGEERLGAVLDLKPLDSLYNIVLKGTK